MNVCVSLSHIHTHTPQNRVLVTEKTKESRGRECMQCGDIGQRDDLFPGGMEQDGVRFYHTPQNHVQFNTYELSISGTFRLIFLDCSSPWITETVESRTAGREHCCMPTMHNFKASMV